jgi:Uncharacterized conserved protein (DUF2303)
MPDPTTNVNAGSIARDLGDQYETLFGTEQLELVRGDAKATVLVTPRGRSVQSIKALLDEYLERPERRAGTAQLEDELSFIAHVNRFKSPASAVFARQDRTKPFVACVIDYYPEGSDPKATDWLGHTSVYAPALSDEWKAWAAMNGKVVPVADFAAFIEDRITDVIVPNLDDPKLKTFADLVQGKWAEPSDLLQLSRGLQINVETQVKNAVTLNTGEIAVQYEETHRDGAGQPIQIANLFQICVPVFYAGVLYRIAARLRYRLINGKIHWSYQLVRPDLVFDDAFKGIVANVRDQTQLPVFLGSPEGK